LVLNISNAREEGEKGIWNANDMRTELVFAIDAADAVLKGGVKLQGFVMPMNGDFFVFISRGDFPSHFIPKPLLNILNIYCDYFTWKMLSSLTE
jgi:hypothetical protein